MIPVTEIEVLKGALHIHTTCSDGGLPPEEVFRVYRDLGFDFIALTDHDFLMKPDAYDAVPDQFEGMLVFKGVEKTVFARGYLHVNHVFGDRELLRILNHPAEFACTAGQVLDRLDELGGADAIDAIEVSQNGFYTPEFDVDEIPFPKVVSDDSHTREGCGRAWVEINCEKDKDTIIRAIKDGCARICCSGTARQSAWSNRGDDSSG